LTNKNACLVFGAPKLAKLPPDDIKAIQNVKLLEGTNNKKKHHGAFSLKFDSQKVNRKLYQGPYVYIFTHLDVLKF